MFGMFLGIIAGKLSYVIVIVSGGSLLLLQLLVNRGAIVINWKGVITVGKEKLSLRNLFFHRPSFKISFFLAFFIAAFSV